MSRGRRYPRPHLVVLLALGLGACDPPGEPPALATESVPRTLVDSDGRSVALAAPARRVVSLVPSATLTLDRLGAREVLVARTDHDTAPWTAALPSVGGGLQPSLEAVVAADPDLVIRFGGPQDTRTPAMLDDLGIAHVAIRPDGIEDILGTVRLLGAAVGRTEAAEALVAELLAGLDSVRAAAHGLPRVRTAYVMGGDPPWVAGPGTYIHELLALAGGENVFADLGTLYASVSVEAFVARPVDVILTPEKGRLGPRVVGGARVEEVGDALELPGPGVVDAAWKVLRLLHPEERR